MSKSFLAAALAFGTLLFCTDAALAQPPHHPVHHRHHHHHRHHVKH